MIKVSLSANLCRKQKLIKQISTLQSSLVLHIVKSWTVVILMLSLTAYRKQRWVWVIIKTAHCSLVIWTVLQKGAENASQLFLLGDASTRSAWKSQLWLSLLEGSAALSHAWQGRAAAKTWATRRCSGPRERLICIARICIFSFSS